MSRMTSLLVAGTLSVLAVMVGLAGSFIHRWASGAGVVLALAAMVALIVLAREWTDSRLWIAAVVVMWIVPVVVLAQTRPEGDVVIAADARGFAFLFGGMLCAGVGIGLGPKTNKIDTTK